jgi:hypothetical protein
MSDVKSIVDEIGELSATGTSKAWEQELKKAERQAHKEKVAAETEMATNVAKAVIAERDRSDKAFVDSNLGTLNDAQLRNYVISRYGFSPL